MAGLLALILSFFFAFAAQADELSLGVSRDMIHKQGMPMYSVQYGPAIAMAWHHNHAVGLVKETSVWGMKFGFGGVYATNTDDDLGTHTNFLIEAKWKALVFRHMSHGAFLGIEPQKANSGLNFLGIEARF